MPMMCFIPYKMKAVATAVLMHLNTITRATDLAGHITADPYLPPGPGVSTEQAYTGTSSIKFNGQIGEALRTTNKTPFTFQGTTSFTFEFFFYPNGQTLGYLYNLGGGEQMTWGSSTVYIDGNSGGNLMCSITAAATGWSIIDNKAAGKYIPSTWNHFAIVWDGSTYSVYLNGVRTLTASSNLPPKAPPYDITLGNFPYSNQTDFQYTGFQGYIDNFRITKNVARYTGATITVPAASTFGRSTAIDPYWNNVALLLGGEAGAVDANGLPYDPDHGVTFIRHAPPTKYLTFDNTQPGFGNGSWKLANSWFPVTDYNAAIGLADFTWEAILRTTVATVSQTYQCIMGTRTSGSISETISLGFGLANSAVYVYADKFLVNAGNVRINEWHHIALVRKSGVFTVYLDGLAVGSYTDTAQQYNFTRPLLMIGGNVAGEGGFTDAGATLTEVRISTVARYTGTFTPPPAPFVVD